MRVQCIDALPVRHILGFNSLDKKPLLTNRSECTLISCFPFDHSGPAPRRLIIQANLIDGVVTINVEINRVTGRLHRPIDVSEDITTNDVSSSTNSSRRFQSVYT